MGFAHTKLIELGGVFSIRLSPLRRRCAMDDLHDHLVSKENRTLL